MQTSMSPEFMGHIKEKYNNQKGQNYPCSNQIVRNIIFAYSLDDVVLDYLQKNNGNINSTVYECLLLKAEDDSIQLPGGLTLANNSEYWLRLAKKYKPNGSRIL